METQAMATFDIQNKISADAFTKAVLKLVDYLAQDEARHFAGEPDHIYWDVYTAALAMTWVRGHGAYLAVRGCAKSLI